MARSNWGRGFWQPPKIDIVDVVFVAIVDVVADGVDVDGAVNGDEETSLKLKVTQDLRTASTACDVAIFTSKT